LCSGLNMDSKYLELVLVSAQEKGLELDLELELE
jgi:hypothetical protein